MEESTNYGDFNPNKTLASIETQIQAEATWIKNWQEMYGDLLIDPETIALSTDNAHLKRLFETTKLNTRNTDHWKFLLSMVIETVYRKGRAGPCSRCKTKSPRSGSERKRSYAPPPFHFQSFTHLAPAGGSDLRLNW